MMGNCREGCMCRMQLLLRHGGSKSTTDWDPLAVDMWAPGVAWQLPPRRQFDAVR